MDKLKLVSPASLKGDDGWKLRDLYSELIIDINKYVLSINCECLYRVFQISTPVYKADLQLSLLASSSRAKLFSQILLIL